MCECLLNTEFNTLEYILIKPTQIRISFFFFNLQNKVIREYEPEPVLKCSSTNQMLPC